MVIPEQDGLAKAGDDVDMKPDLILVEVPLGRIGKTRKGRKLLLWDQTISQAMWLVQVHHHLALTSSFLPVRPTLAPRMSYCRSMNLGLLDLRVPIHAFKALCVRFYYCAGANPLLSICPPAFAILKDCIKTLYMHLFYYACLWSSYVLFFKFALFCILTYCSLTIP